MIDTETRIRRYSSSREGSAGWTDPEIVEAWRNGRIEDVPARTLEFAPSLRCNMGLGEGGCTECPYTQAKRDAGCNESIARGQFAEADDRTVASLDRAKLVLDRCQEHGVRAALFTGGGEPTVCPDIVEMIAYSATVGMYNSLYTNLIQLGEHSDLAGRLMAPTNNLVFVRGSLNFVKPHTGRKFSRATAEQIEAQCRGLAALYDARTERLSEYAALGRRAPSVQVSVVCDHRNVDDLALIAATVAKIHSGHSPAYHDPNDDFVARPLTKHGRQGGYTFKQHDEWVVNKIRAEFRSGDPSRDLAPGPSRELLENAGMKVYLGFGVDRLDAPEAEALDLKSYEDLVRAEYASRDRCWANGLFLSVGPAGTVHLCTDRNCFHDWRVGDLTLQSVDQVYHSESRRRLLDGVHNCSCGPTVCEPTCRTVRLNAIARAIRSGELTLDDIQEIRRRAAGERPMLLS